MTRRPPAISESDVGRAVRWGLRTAVITRVRGDDVTIEFDPGQGLRVMICAPRELEFPADPGWWTEEGRG